MNAADDRLAELEAQAVLLRSRIRAAADDGNVDEVERLYLTIPTLRLRLLAARHTVARVVRHETQQYGFNSALTAAEHRLDIELAGLGLEPEKAMRNVFG